MNNAMSAMNSNRVSMSVSAMPNGISGSFYTNATFNQTPGAVANALVGEKSIAILQYAITGDSEVDFMSGLTALVAQDYLPNEARIRCLTHFIERLGGEVKITPKILKELKERLEQLERRVTVGTVTPDGTNPYQNIGGTGFTPSPFRLP